ncbi:MAG: hypothetical protein ACI8T1_000422 [Verrucomicrobiales bacterium]|jgi:hypothetical protein
MKSDQSIDLSRLASWYASQCNGTWEQECGMRLETLDNPGWCLTVDLHHTALGEKEMKEISEGCDADAMPTTPVWIHCSVQESQFVGACDQTQPHRLLEIFEAFRNAP